MFNFENGEMLLVDKPLKWTSFDIVKKIRYATGVRKVGHAGTLDPLASGLLIICTGRMTKKIYEFQDRPKEYTGTFAIGQTTPSYDLETQVSEKKETGHISKKDLNNSIAKFTGKILQVPPAHSAIKKDGIRVYKKARSGEIVKLDPREVTVHNLKITGFKNPLVEFALKCSKGFYVRSLVRDFGETLGTGAYLASLRRTKIGEFSVEDAWQIDDLVKSILEWRSTKG
jgi:tRNA pseudouridine55 synthase